MKTDMMHDGMLNYTHLHIEKQHKLTELLIIHAGVKSVGKCALVTTLNV